MFSAILCNSSQSPLTPMSRNFLVTLSRTSAFQARPPALLSRLPVGSSEVKLSESAVLAGNFTVPTGADQITINYTYIDNGIDVDPDTVMQILSDYLNPILPVLKKLRKIPQEVYDKQLDMLNNYHLHDVYQWYSIMNGIYN